MTRKYTTEFNLVLPVFIRGLCRQSDLAGADVSDFSDCHIYVVSRTPNFSLPPENVEIGDDQIACTVRAQRANQFEDAQITIDHALGANLSWRSHWPYEDFAIVDGDDETVVSGAVGLLSAKAKGWPDSWRHHEVLYVGQAFGAAGERSAWDRLQSHGTVQRILSENPRDKQVWIGLAAIDDMSLLQEISPLPATVPDDEDDAHVATVWKAWKDGTIAERDSVALAEAGLIRAFQPEYNDRLKYNFPARRQVPLEEARRLDLNQLFIELQGQHAGAAYWSEAVDSSPNMMQFFEYSIHLDEDRSGLLGLDKGTDRNVES